MSGKVTRGLCALAAGTALAAFTSVTAGTAGAAPGAARSLAAAETGHPAGAPGSQLWVQRYNGPGNSFDAASSVAVSPGGSRVFVTGASQGARSGPDYATVAYSAVTGARLWAARYNGPGNGSDAASAVAVSPGGGRVFVTGASQGTRSGPDYATVAYSAVTGARLWAARYNGPGNGSDAASAVAVSPGGSRVFVTGASRGATTTGYLTVAYSAATGARLWAAALQRPGKRQRRGLLGSGQPRREPGVRDRGKPGDQVGPGLRHGGLQRGDRRAAVGGSATTARATAATRPTRWRSAPAGAGCS